jgi:ribosomal protein S18
MPIQRPEARKRESFHRKKLFCPFCKNMVNHIECKNPYEVQEFKENFAKGEYLQEAKDSMEVCTNG